MSWIKRQDPASESPTERPVAAPWKKALTRAAVILFVCLATGLTWGAGWLDDFDSQYYDAWHTLTGRRHIPLHTVIVAVDDEALLMYRDEPLVFWGPHFAKAIETIRAAGGRLIVMDYLFSVSAESWLRKIELGESEASRTFDLPLREQLAGGGVFLSGALAADRQGHSELLLPIQDYFFVLPGGLADIGLANFYSDPDGAVRRFMPALSAAPDPPRLSMAALMAVHALGLDPNAPSWRINGTYFANAPQTYPIGYTGPPGTVPRLSLAALLAPDALQDPRLQVLKDKIIIIAGEHVGVQDIHLTPYARGFLGRPGRVMSGPEVHANIIETMLSGRYPRPLPNWLPPLVFSLTILLAFALFFRLRLWPGLFTGLALVVIAALAGYMLFRLDRILPVTGMQEGVALSYLGVLAVKLTGEEKERTRLRGMFGQYVSDEVVEKLLATGHRPDLGGETLPVTVLFSDIRNFTTMSERLSASEVVEMLNAYLERACEPILKGGGTVDKFIGDAIMAIFGSPVPHADHARRAIRAALAMVENAQGFAGYMNDRFPGRDLPPFRIGVGLHTGPAVIGNIGSPKRIEFTAIGDTVNTASRLEGLTKELGWRIVASVETLAAAGPGVTVGGRESRPVKGRQQEVEVVEILNLEDNGETES